MSKGASFVVYIDESGDEGFKFAAGSTEWFILSAVVIEKANDLKVVKLIDTVRALLERKDKEPLHFRKMKHEHRVPLIHAIAQANLKLITVMVHKPSIVNIENFEQKYRLYFYATRLLLERVSCIAVSGCRMSQATALPRLFSPIAAIWITGS
jgi:hypothetical protein